MIGCRNVSRQITKGLRSSLFTVVPKILVINKTDEVVYVRPKGNREHELRLEPEGRSPMFFVNASDVLLEMSDEL